MLFRSVRSVQTEAGRDSATGTASVRQEATDLRQTGTGADSREIVTTETDAGSRETVITATDFRETAITETGVDSRETAITETATGSRETVITETDADSRGIVITETDSRETVITETADRGASRARDRTAAIMTEEAVIPVSRRRQWRHRSRSAAKERARMTIRRRITAVRMKRAEA